MLARIAFDAITAVIAVLIAKLLSPSRRERQQPSKPKRTNARTRQPQQQIERSGTMPRCSHEGNGRNYELDARKAVATLDFILRSYGLQRWWRTDAERENYVHDLQVMMQNGDLSKADLEIVAADRSVLYRHSIYFTDERNPRCVDSACGIELPMIDRSKIAEHRLLVSPFRRVDSYRSQLRLSWGPADKLRDKVGGSFESEHTNKSTGGRNKAQVFVADDARHIGIVLNVSPAADYAFAHDSSLNVNVFLHRKFCLDGVLPGPGQKVSYVVIQTPRGLQGRNIRAA
jgi:hypothetical protein